MVGLCPQRLDPSPHLPSCWNTQTPLCPLLPRGLQDTTPCPRQVPARKVAPTMPPGDLSLVHPRSTNMPDVNHPWGLAPDPVDQKTDTSFEDWTPETESLSTWPSLSFLAPPPAPGPCPELLQLDALARARSGGGLSPELLCCLLSSHRLLSSRIT